MPCGNEVEYQFREPHVHTAKKVLGVRSNKNKPWIPVETLRAPLERRKLKETINTSRSTRIKSNLEAKYRLKDKEIKGLTRRDKRKFVDDMATKVARGRRRQWRHEDSLQCHEAVM